MTHLTRSLSALAFCLTIFQPAGLLAQQPAQRNPQKAPAKSGAASKPASETDPLAQARRTTALALVNTLADEARNFSDPVLRANVQARAADSLWETDQARARVLFERAWEAAETADKESGEARAREAGRRGAPSSRDAGSVRREVLRLAARRESALGDAFLKRLDESAKQEAGSASSNPATDTPQQPAQSQRINPDDPPSTMTQRLSLARQLLEDGEVERAMQFAGPALYPVNTFGANILDMLRERNRELADREFARLVATAANDPLSDANTVSLLSSYAFTPYMYVTVGSTGNAHTRRWRGDNTPPADFSPQLREMFLRTAAQILTRPLPPTEQDPTWAGRAGAYMLITRLAPLFERYTPDIAAQVRARQSQLSTDAPAQNRPDDQFYTRGLQPEPSRADQLQDMLGRLDNAKTPDERDMIYFRLAMNFAEEDMTRARDYASKIEDIDTRRQLLGALAWRGLESAIRGNRAEEAVRLARAEELTTIQRTWALTEAARLVAKEQPGRAVELLEEASAEAKKIDQGTADRVRALVAIATRMQALDHARAWDMMSEVVKASNQAADFTGEDGQIMVRVQFKGGGAMTNNNSVESFDLEGLFAALAREDVNRAAELARGFKQEAPRSAATLAVARAVLIKPRERAGQVNQQETRSR